MKLIPLGPSGCKASARLGYLLCSGCGIFCMKWDYEVSTSDFEDSDFEVLDVDVIMQLYNDSNLYSPDCILGTN